MSLMTNFEICPTIRQTLFHGINFISRIKLKEQTENLKFQPVHFYVTATEYEAPPPPTPEKKKNLKKKSQLIVIQFHSISIYFIA